MIEEAWFLSIGIPRLPWNVVHLILVSAQPHIKARSIWPGKCLKISQSWNTSSAVDRCTPETCWYIVSQEHLLRKSGRRDLFLSLGIPRLPWTVVYLTLVGAQKHLPRRVKKETCFRVLEYLICRGPLYTWILFDAQLILN